MLIILMFISREKLKKPASFVVEQAFVEE